MEFLNIPRHGEIKNIKIETVLNDVSITWQHDSIYDTSNYRYQIALNGETIGVTTALSYSLDGIDSGNHRLDIAPIAPGQSLPDLHGDFYGRVAYLKWSPTSETDLASYNIYSDNGTGTIDFENPVDSVSDVIIYPLSESYAFGYSTGGRISLSGDWSGEKPYNGYITIKTFSEGRFKYYLSGWSDYIDINPQVDLPYGIRVVFHDEADTYHINGEYTSGIGIVNYWTSEKLEEGNHLFSVKAVDLACNESDALTEQPISIIHRPSDVSSLSISWDGSMISLSWILPNDSDLDYIYIYSNYSLIYGSLQNFILEETPWETITPSATGFSFTPSVDGEWKFYVRTLDKDGRESDSAELLEIDTTDIPTSLSLNTPESIQAVPVAGGKLQVSWNYKVDEGRDISGFKVYIDSTPYIVSLPTDFFVSYIHQMTYTSAALTSGQEYTIKVSAYNGSNEKISDEVQVTADSTAPVFGAGSILWGVSN